MLILISCILIQAVYLYRLSFLYGKSNENLTTCLFQFPFLPDIIKVFGYDHAASFTYSVSFIESWAKPINRVDKPVKPWHAVHQSRRFAEQAPVDTHFRCDTDQFLIQRCLTPFQDCCPSQTVQIGIGLFRICQPGSLVRRTQRIRGAALGVEQEEKGRTMSETVSIFSQFFRCIIVTKRGGGDMRILLAEDEKRMAAALVALLKQEKYDVDHTYVLMSCKVWPWPRRSE